MSYRQIGWTGVDYFCIVIHLHINLSLLKSFEGINSRNAINCSALTNSLKSYIYKITYSTIIVAIPLGLNRQL